MTYSVDSDDEYFALSDKVKYIYIIKYEMLGVVSSQSVQKQ